MASKYDNTEISFHPKVPACRKASRVGAGHSVHAARRTDSSLRRAWSDAPHLTYIEIFFVTILKREPLEIKNPFHHPGGCQQNDDGRAETEREPLIYPGTAQPKSQRQEDSDNGQLPELHAEIESHKRQRERLPRQTEIRQRVGEAEAMNESKA